MPEFKMVNKMETAVKYALEEVLSQNPNVCQCERCRLDISALALNNLQPRYAVSEFGEVMTHLDLETFQWKAEVVVAIIKALDLVSKKPRHNPK